MKSDTILEEEKQFAQAIKEGNKDEFNKFYNLHHKKVLTLILFLSKSNEFAEDAAQETFIRVWENREQLDETQSLIAYVRQISRNLVIDYLRKDQKIKQFSKKSMELSKQELYSSENEITQNLDKKELEQLLDQALHCISPKRKSIFFQSRFEEKSYKEIAMDMETTPKAVERHMAKTMSFLRRQLSAHYNRIILFFVFLLGL